MQQCAPALVGPTIFRPICIRTVSAMFYPRHTPSNDREQYLIFDSGAMRYGPSTIITGSYADRRKAPLSGGDRSCTSALGRTAPIGFGTLPDSLTNVGQSDFRLFSQLQGIINLDAEVAHGAFELGVPEQ